MDKAIPPTPPAKKVPKKPKVSKAKSKPAKAAAAKATGKPRKSKDVDAGPPVATALAVAEPTKRRAHRSPVLRTEAIEQAILERLRDGESLAAICRTDGMPSERLVRMWALEDAPFADQYRRARM